MEGARATWTDERLDDLARRMDDGFNRVEQELRALRVGVDAQGIDLAARIDAQGADLGARIDAQGDKLGARIDVLHQAVFALQRTMLQVCGAACAASLAALVSVLVTLH